MRVPANTKIFMTANTIAAESALPSLEPPIYSLIGGI
jgi:hypothetical protein